MTTKADLKLWVVQALRELGGSGSVIEVSRWVHGHKMQELERSGGLLYRWQYDLRWAAQELRDEGRLKPAEGRKNP